MVESAPPQPGQPGQPEPVQPGQPEPSQPRPSQPRPSQSGSVQPGYAQPRSGQPGSGQPRSGRQLAVIAACYVMLFLLGVAEGVVGAFLYSGGIGPIPGAALGFGALLLVTCLLAAWGMYRPTAGLMPAVGWFAATFVLAMRTPGGSIVITNTAAGKWFLFGGAACAAAGVVASFTIWSAGRGQRPSELRSGPVELRPRKPGS